MASLLFSFLLSSFSMLACFSSVSGRENDVAVTPINRDLYHRCSPENEIDAAAGRQESIPNGLSPDHHRSGDVSPSPCFFLHRPCLFPAIIQSMSNSRRLPIP
ncbi:unnamed protein product [Linum trigynum]|uniref:Secreted protein n=1 Tax=Linum trigynum TaxID=586398 RepID=A0AAV2DQQ9_9ROSI